MISLTATGRTTQEPRRSAAAPTAPGASARDSISRRARITCSRDLSSQTVTYTRLVCVHVTVRARTARPRDPPPDSDCPTDVTVPLMEIGDRIRFLIDSKDMKDVWVADGAGISKTTLSNIIRGTTLDPKVSTMAAIADVLGESVDALLGRVGHPLLTHEQDTLRSAVSIITDRVLGPPNDQRVATTPLRRRRPKPAKPTAVVTSIAATPAERSSPTFGNCHDMRFHATCAIKACAAFLSSKATR